jgi:hypothetical protein
VRPRAAPVVFATEKGGVYSHSGFQSIWLPALLAAGLAHEEKRNDGRTIVIADFRFHWLRHTAISLIARAGMKAELIAERVGHKGGGALIYRRDRHLFPSEVREAVSMLDRMIAGTGENAELGAQRVVNRWSTPTSAPRKSPWLREESSGRYWARTSDPQLVELVLTG